MREVRSIEAGGRPAPTDPSVAPCRPGVLTVVDPAATLDAKRPP